MTKKQKFIDFVECITEKTDWSLVDEDVKIYWDAFRSKEEIEKPLFTDNGKLILQHLQNNLDTPMWKAKDIAEGLFVSSRTVSGAIRKLVSDGFVEKVGQDPVVYTITEKGKNIEII